MDNFPKTDYASARRHVHEHAWQEYLKTQRSLAQANSKPQSKIGRALNKLLFWN